MGERERDELSLASDQLATVWVFLSFFQKSKNDVHFLGVRAIEMSELNLPYGQF